MPKVPKGRRKRAYRPKTRSGCLTCKVRRIKCDETRPACLRCTSTRRICGGYSSEPSTLSPTSQSSSPPENLLYHEVDKGLSLNIHPCDQSARSFNFFAQYTCHQLAGFFESPFWERLVLQTGQHEPTIRHALVAIGSLHMQQQDKRPSGHRDIEKTFALQQYNLAIRSLLALASRSPEGQRVRSRVPVDVCLISSILFACFENMQGHHKEAGCHITGGVKLLKETVYDSENGWLRKEVLGRQSSQNPYIPLETLASLFAGLSDEADMIIRDYKWKAYEGYFFTDVLEHTSKSPPIFTSVQEAKDVFEYGHALLQRKFGTHYLGDQALNMIQGRQAYMTTLMSTFANAIQHFIRTRADARTVKEQVAIMALQLHLLYVQVSLHFEQIYLLQSSDTSEDGITLNQALTTYMSEMVELGEKIISTISTENKDTSLHSLSETTSFYLGQLGYVIPLYTVASQCQDTTLRRRAIALLRSTSRQEGVWNSILVANACERMMQIEEQTGARLAAFVDADGYGLGHGHDSSGALPSILRLDHSGGYLRYELRNQDGLPISGEIVEKVFDW